jgi:hypothetical protein
MPSAGATPNLTLPDHRSLHPEAVPCPVTSSRAATIYCGAGWQGYPLGPADWGRPLGPACWQRSQRPEQNQRCSRLAAMWGRLARGTLWVRQISKSACSGPSLQPPPGIYAGMVENRASSFSQTRGVPAGREEVRAGEVFIAFDGPRGHVERLTRGTLWVQPIGKSAGPEPSPQPASVRLVGQPILATAAFQRPDAPEARCIEPLTAPEDRFTENKWLIGAVTGERPDAPEARCIEPLAAPGRRFAKLSLERQAPRSS